MEESKFCPACGQKNNASAQFCQRCGIRYESSTPTARPTPKKSNPNPGLLIFLAITAALLIAALLIQTAPPLPAPERAGLTNSPALITSPTPALSPAEHLAEARKLMNEYFCKYGCEAATQHLDAIPSGAKEHKEATRLSGVLKQRLAKGEAILKREAEKQEAEERKAAERRALQGVTAICADGSYSYSAHRRGTCSHHGGVARWISQ
jgi:Protein of unknown function (DUF3761)